MTATGPRGTVTGCNAGNSGPAYATRWSRLGLRGVRQRPAHNPQVASISRAYPAHCRTTGQPQHRPGRLKIGVGQVLASELSRVTITTPSLGHPVGGSATSLVHRHPLSMRHRHDKQAATSPH